MTTMTLHQCSPDTHCDECAAEAEAASDRLVERLRSIGAFAAAETKERYRANSTECACGCGESA